MNCDRCGEPLTIERYRVTSSILDMIVCEHCAWAAAKLAPYQGEGALLVVQEITKTLDK